MQIKLLIEGGNLVPNPGLSQKIGPLGLNLSQVIKKVNEETSDFKGLKVPVELDINTSTKDFTVKVFSPPVSGLLKKELGIEKGSGSQKKIQVANASIEQIISVSKSKFPSMLSRDFKSAVKTVVGTCVSLGILIENKKASEIEKDIEEGKYDKEINSEKTETSEEKKQELDAFFSEIKSKQEMILKKEQEAKESEAQKVEEVAKEEKPEEKSEDKKTTKK